MSVPSFPTLRGADFFPFADVPLSVFRVVNESYPRHGHDFHEIVLVAGGTAWHEAFAPDSDVAERTSLSEGDMVLIPLGWSHRYKECAELDIFNVLFAPHFLDQWARGEGALEFNGGAMSASTKWSLQRGEREHLETLLQTIIRELTGRQRGFGIAAGAKMAEVLVWLDRLNTRPHERRAPESQDDILRAVAFMEKHFAEPIVLADIARAAHLSAHYFCEVFKNGMGLPPGRYLLRLRLEHARYLLLSTTRPITAIATEAGFADASYFARAFKSAFGTSPSRLRASGR